MQRTFFRLSVFWLCIARFAVAQTPLLTKPSAADGSWPPSVSSLVASPLDGTTPASVAIPSPDRAVSLAAPVALPRMAPELALQVCRGRSVIQASQLASYSATTLIRAQLPDTSQSGEYEVQRR